MIPQNQQQSKIFCTSTSLSLSAPYQSSVSLTISAYPNCILIVINEKGTLGSILRGTAEIHARIEQRQDQFDDQEEEITEKKESEKERGNQFVYQIKVLFGSTQIQFYEILMRKILEFVFEDRGMKLDYNGQKCKVILNISLSKVHSEVFQTNMAKYYEAITNKISEILPEVL